MAGCTVMGRGCSSCRHGVMAAPWAVMGGSHGVMAVPQAFVIGGCTSGVCGSWLLPEGFVGVGCSPRGHGAAAAPQAVVVWWLLLGGHGDCSPCGPKKWLLALHMVTGSGFLLLVQSPVVAACSICSCGWQLLPRLLVQLRCLGLKHLASGRGVWSRIHSSPQPGRLESGYYWVCSSSLAGVALGSWVVSDRPVWR